MGSPSLEQGADKRRKLVGDVPQRKPADLVGEGDLRFQESVPEDLTQDLSKQVCHSSRSQSQIGNACPHSGIPSQRAQHALQ